MFRVVIVMLLAAAALSCRNERAAISPSGPTSQFPSTIASFDDSPTFTRLEGGVTYNGSATKSVPALAGSITCPTSTSVRRDGSHLVIAPLLLEGECHNLGMPVGEMTIDATGNIQATDSGIYRVSCGTYAYTTTGTLSGNDLRLSITATSQTCPNFTMVATLSR